MNQFVGIIVPLLLHLCMTEVVAVVSGGRLDAAARTLFVSVLVLPWAVWMYRKDRREAVRSVGKYGMQDVRRSLCCLAAGGILNLIWSGLMNLCRIHQYFSNDTQEELLAGQLIVQLVSMGFLVPLTEELIFRGLIYQRMRKMLPLMQSVLLASALFAVYHGNMIQIIFAFPMAVIICVLYEKWKLLRYPVLFHMGCNLVAIIFGLFS